MILFGLWCFWGIIHFYIAAKQADFYRLYITDTTNQLSFKILNNALAKPLVDKTRREVLFVKRVYTVYVILFYCCIGYALFEIYRSAINLT
jgi:hypothetical protein